MRRITLALAALVWLFAGAAVAQPEYVPPTLTHWCTERVTLPDGSVSQQPGQINVAATPETAGAQWFVARYGPGFRFGAPGMHSSDLLADLETLGIKPTLVAVYDAYCTQSETDIRVRALAVRLQGDEHTPFRPGLWRAFWTTVSWRTHVAAAMRSWEINLGRPGAELRAASILAQVELAERSCAGEVNPASDPAAGGWGLNKAGACIALKKTRPGELGPEWGRVAPIRFPGEVGWEPAPILVR